MCFGGGGSAPAAPPPPAPIPAPPIAADASVLAAGNNAKLRAGMGAGFGSTILQSPITTPVPPGAIAGKQLLGGT